MSLLELADIAAGYGEIDIVSGIALTVEPAEIVTVAGTNGAGKSTVAKAIVGVVPRCRGRMTFDGRLLIGGGRKDNKPLENDTTDDRINDPVQRYLDNYLKTRFPDVTAPVDRRWAGIMGFSADGVPLVGTLPGSPRIGFAVGFTGHGLAFGAGTAERAVDHLINGTAAGAVSASRLD